jgi:hypothetical protein
MRSWEGETMSDGSSGKNPFDLLVGKALIDSKFRAKVLDPKRRAAALKEVGIANPTAEQLQALGNAISALENLEGEFAPGIGTA